MLPWCIFLEHWIRVFSHHVINCLYDIHHFLPWQHASRSTKRKLRAMRAHFCLALPYSSPSFSYDKPAPGMPVHVRRDTNILQKELLLSVPAMPRAPSAPSPTLAWLWHSRCWEQGLCSALHCGTNFVQMASSMARDSHSWNWESDPSPHLAQIAPQPRSQ